MISFLSHLISGTISVRQVGPDISPILSANDHHHLLSESRRPHGPNLVCIISFNPHKTRFIKVISPVLELETQAQRDEGTGTK